MKPLVIPVFIAHQGCPHRCIFCDQYTITAGADADHGPVTPEKVQETIRQWLYRSSRKKRAGVQVAFYGGSFTGLDRQRQKELLVSVAPFVAAGQVDCIRISTRPDYIDDQVISLLKGHGVAIVELGIQSLAQDVLEASARGHSVQQSEEALRLLKQNGFTVGAQLMCGLPGDTTARLMATAAKTAALAPDFVRLYPVLVLKGSGLEKLWQEGRYRALSLEKAVALCCRMKTIFGQHGIKVVRMGLHCSEELATKVVAGPCHPAFGELVISRALFKKTRQVLSRIPKSPAGNLRIAAADESVFRGPGNVNTKRLAALGLLEGVKLVFDAKLTRNSIICQ